MIDILVPVLGRPHRARPLVENIAANTRSDHQVIFICSPSDLEQRFACELTSAASILVAEWEPGPGDYARKINMGFRYTDSEWVFLGADDLCFCPGWDVHALATADVTGASVVGTDDLGNPKVKAGQHSTHSLVRRSYISQQGGSWDGPGTVYSPVYDHQYVDSELVEVAKQRGVWAFSHASKVEHMHAFWGKSDRDATYDKALRASNEDYQLFKARKEEFS